MINYRRLARAVDALAARWRWSPHFVETRAEKGRIVLVVRRGFEVERHRPVDGYDVVVVEVAA